MEGEEERMEIRVVEEEERMGLEMERRGGKEEERMVVREEMVEKEGEGRVIIVEGSTLQLTVINRKGNVLNVGGQGILQNLVGNRQNNGIHIVTN